MKTRTSFFADYEAVLEVRELELVRQKSAVLDFVVNPHTANHTREQILALREAEAKLNQVLENLLEVKTRSQFKAEAEKLCARCRELGVHTRDMNKILTDDLTERHRAEEHAKVDVLKNVTFLLTPPSVFAGIVKGGLGGSDLNAFEAATAGVALSSSILFRKKIAEGFRSAAAGVCQTPRKIKDSFLLFYIREMAKEKARQSLHNLYAIADGIHNQISKSASMSRKFAIKVGQISWKGVAKMASVLPIKRRPTSERKNKNPSEPQL